MKVKRFQWRITTVSNSPISTYSGSSAEATRNRVFRSLKRMRLHAIFDLARTWSTRSSPAVKCGRPAVCQSGYGALRVARDFCLNNRGTSPAAFHSWVSDGRFFSFWIVCKVVGFFRTFASCVCRLNSAFSRVLCDFLVTVCNVRVPVLFIDHWVEKDYVFL